MAGVNVKMGVTGVSEFKRNMNDAKSAVKTFDEQLKLNEAQLKLTGNQEQFLTNKAKILKDQIEAQKKVCQEAEKALKSMEQNGVSKSSAAYQKMYQSVLQSATKLQGMKTDLKNVETGAFDAAQKTDVMNTSLQNIGKNVSWSNISDGLEKITSKLESGARAAMNIGKNLYNSFSGSTGEADEILTTVQKYSDMGLTADSYQRMKNVAKLVDTPVDAILTARERMNKALATEKGVESLEDVLGINLEGQTSEDLFWEIGEALKNMGEGFDKESAANKLFGRSWRELMPLFSTGRDAYTKMLEEQNVLTDDQIQKLGKADDMLRQMETELARMKNAFWADNAENITKLFQWLVDNKDGVKTALEVIGAGFAGLKLAEFSANLLETVNAFKSLKLIPGNTPTETGGMPTGGNTGGNGNWLTGLFGKGWDAVKAYIAKDGAWAMTPLAVLLAGTMPAISANNADYERIEKETQERLEAASKLTNSQERAWMEQAALALGLKRDASGNLEKNFLGQYVLQGNEQSVIDLLMGMKDRSGIEMSKLHNLLNGSSSAWNGNYTWNELQALWNGTGDFDHGRMNALLDSVVSAYEDRISRLEVQSNNNNTQQNTTGDIDMDAFNGLPAAMKNAVENANISVVITQSALNGIANHTDTSLGSKLQSFLGL